MSFKFWTMKKLLSFFVMFSLFLGAVSFAPAVSAYDDFTGPLIDDQKWITPEFVRETLNGKLSLKVANAVNLSYNPRITLPIINPSSVHSIECFITVANTSSTDTGDNAKLAGRIDGFFYNTKVSGGATGDVYAGVHIGNRGSGLEAWYEIVESLNDGPTEFNLVSSNTIIPIGILSYDTAYRAKISYDGVTGFTFEVNGQSVSTEGPERQRNAVYLFKGIAAVAYGTAGNGYASILFDDVFVNAEATVYDDFSSQLIDPAKWANTESVRECSNGYLRLNIRGSGSTKANDISLVERDASYVKAKVRIDSSSQLSSGANGIARIGGNYYNDSRGPGSGQDYNKYIGDVNTHVQLNYNSNGSMSASVWVGRCNDENDTNYTTLFSHTFATPITLDTFYNLSIEYKDNKLIFACEGEMVEYQIATPSYTPYLEHRLLRSRVYLDSGETGYMKTIFDNVIIRQAAIPSPPTLSSPAANANVAGTSVNLTWSASTGATQYWLWARRTSDNVLIFNQSVGNKTSHTLTGLPNNGGDYYWMVRAGNSSGWSGWTAARRFYNGGGTTIPTPPTLNTPTSNANVPGTSVNLTWSASTGATQYWLWAKRTSDNVVIFNQNIGNKTSYNLTGLPNNGGSYYWMVRAGNSSGWSTWPAARRFFNGTAAVPAPPILSSPASNANVAGTSVNLSWSASTGATQYWLWVKRASDNAVIFNQSVGNTTSRALTDLPNNGGSYYWMVRAYNSGGWSGWPVARRFFNGTAAIPALPNLISPASNANVPGTSVNLSWSASTGATQYWLWAKRTSDNVVIFNQNIGNKTSYNLTGLPNNGGSYYWMVRAGNSGGWSGWTVARRFFNIAVSVHSDNDGDLTTPAQGDCNDSDFGIRPGAPEICEDGIDQDCDGQDRSCQLRQFTSGGTYVNNSGLLTLHTTYSDFPGDEGLPLGITKHHISQITTTSLIVSGDDYDSMAWVRKSGLPDNLVGVWAPLKTEGLEQTELRFQSDNTFTYTVKEVAWITQNKTITIDGDFSDWTEQDRIYIDNDGPDCNNARGQDIREIYIARDKGFIYLRYVLNSPMDQTCEYKFGSDQRHIYVAQINGSGRIFYGNAYGQPQPNLPQEFLKINGNQFECKFYVTDIESWKNIRWLAAWLDQGVQTQCRDRVVMAGLDLGL